MVIADKSSLKTHLFCDTLETKLILIVHHDSRVGFWMHFASLSVLSVASLSSIGCLQGRNSVISLHAKPRLVYMKGIAEIITYSVIQPTVQRLHSSKAKRNRR